MALYTCTRCGFETDNARLMRPATSGRRPRECRECVRTRDRERNEHRRRMLNAERSEQLLAELAAIDSDLDQWLLLPGSLPEDAAVVASVARGARRDEAAGGLVAAKAFSNRRDRDPALKDMYDRAQKLRIYAHAVERATHDDSLWSCARCGGHGYEQPVVNRYCYDCLCPRVLRWPPTRRCEGCRRLILAAAPTCPVCDVQRQRSAA